MDNLRGSSDANNQSNLRNFSAYIITVVRALFTGNIYVQIEANMYIKKWVWLRHVQIYKLICIMTGV